MKKYTMIRAALALSFAVACTAVVLTTCSTELIEDIQDDVTAQKEKDALEEEEGKTSETRKPVISVFAWSTVENGTTDNPTVAFNLTVEPKAVSTDGAATIAGYFLKENSTAPKVSDASWLTDKPTSYTFSAEAGERDLYVWVKDSLGNLSTASSLAVDLEPLGWASSGIYLAGINVPAHEEFRFTTNDIVVAEGASVSGIGTGTVEVDETGKVVTVKPDPHWSTGTKTLSLTVRTQYGLPLTRELSVKLFNGVCVSETGNGTAGTARAPLGSISEAPGRAKTLYGTTASEIHVAEGDYATDWEGSVDRITMMEGISLLGGYSSNWVNRNSQTYKTTITDESETGGTAVNPNRALDVPDTVTSATVIDGLWILAGTGTHSAAIFCQGSPLIRDCDIFAGGNGTATDYRYGVVFYHPSTSITPEITQCRINKGSGGGSNIEQSVGIYFSTYACPGISKCDMSGGLASLYTYAISSSDSIDFPRINDNKMEGGTARYSACISILGLDSVDERPIYNNLFLSGTAETGFLSYCIYTSRTVQIRNNTFIFGLSSNTPSEYGIYNANTASGSAIDNNLFISTKEDRVVFGVKTKNAGVELSSLNNNDFNDFSDTGHHRIYGVDVTNYTNVSDVNALGFADSNFTADPAVDTNYNLTAESDANVVSGGLDGEVKSWGFTTDRFGNTRTGNGTTGWSIGCHEYD